MFDKVLNVPPVMNIPGVGMCQSFGNSGVLNMRLVLTQQAHNIHTTLVSGHIYVTSYMDVYTTLLQRM